jgi:hypothetical protein
LHHVSELLQVACAAPVFLLPMTVAGAVPTEARTASGTTSAPDERALHGCDDESYDETSTSLTYLDHLDWQLICFASALGGPRNSVAQGHNDITTSPGKMWACQVGGCLLLIFNFAAIQLPGSILVGISRFNAIRLIYSTACSFLYLILYIRVGPRMFATQRGFGIIIVMVSMLAFACIWPMFLPLPKLPFGSRLVLLGSNGLTILGAGTVCTVMLQYFIHGELLDPIRDIMWAGAARVMRFSDVFTDLSVTQILFAQVCVSVSGT